MSLLIRQGHIIDPSTNTNEVMDLLVEGNTIVQVGKDLKVQAEEIIDATGKVVMPGFIDLHVHLREPGFEYKETIKTGAMAAAKGGFTTICPMPNTNPSTDCVEVVELVLEKAKQDAVVNVLPIGAVTVGQRGDELADIKAMVEAGVYAISEDGKSVMETNLYREAMKAAKENGVPVFAHCEDRSLVNGGVMNAGKKAEELGLPGITNAVEDVIVARDILMAKETGCQLHLCHCSTEDSVVLTKMAKEMKLPVTAEVCPHHFAMCDEDITEDHGNFKMNPPLRSRQDVQALKEGLRDGVMDVIATDHAPHGKEENDQSFMKSPFGIVGLETAFGLSVTSLVKEGYLTPMQLVEKLSYNPAKILGIDKGSLAVGRVADIVIADLNAEYTIDVNTFASKGKNTPFDGKKVHGRVEITVVNGKVVYHF